MEHDHICSFLHTHTHTMTAQQLLDMKHIPEEQNLFTITGTF